jgi:protein-S-isoprenylcysteine O-methyltransferase Ste14
MEEKTANDLQGQVRRRIGQVVLQALLLDVLLFLSAWTLRWVWGWAYVVVGLGLLVLNATVLSPEVIAERGSAHKKNVKKWDRVLSAIMSSLMLVVPILCGLDRHFGWSPAMPWWIHVAGLVGIALGQGLFTWSMVSNRFFSTMVRIQTERAHTVETSGPYRYVRHPGYVGYIVAVIGTVLALGSTWALILVALGIILFVVRTALEDRTLHQELPGYAEYAARVRYRLLPGVW